MQILFVSNYFPPEVNAPASRLIEHARVWNKAGNQVQVLTSIPNFPEGRVYKGFKNKYGRETIEGVDVIRVPMYVTANKGTLKRTLSYISFMLSAWWFARKIKSRPDVLVATSPQFFAAIAGYLIARRMRVPFVLEIRDLWPESIVAVGAVNRNFVIRFFEKLELFLYRKADHIVALTNAFKYFIHAKGIPQEKITVLKNGADLKAWQDPLDESRLQKMKEKYGVAGKFVAAYIGTIGMAHRADVILEAAKLCKDPDIIFMIVGTGAARDHIENLQKEYNLKNFVLGDKVPKEEVRYVMGLTDVSIVHLKASPLFKTVIPSKIFEAMATGTPIVLGVEGEAKEIIEDAEAGIPITPEDAEAMLTAIQSLKKNPNLYEQMAKNGFDHVRRFYDRKVIAQAYLRVLKSLI